MPTTLRPRRLRRVATAAVVLLLPLLAWPASGQVEKHPRLFVTPARLAEVRAAIQEPGSTHHEAFAAMRARVERADWRAYTSDPASSNRNYPRSYLAREAALTYLLTGDRRYAQIAFDALYDVHRDPGDGRLPEADYGLSRATVGIGFAIAYDWAYHGFTVEQRAYLKEKIRVALDAWPAYRHGNLETEHQGSNWVAVSRGGELVMMLAAYEEDDRPERFALLRGALLRHMQTAYGPSGWSQEGIGYTSYAGQFLLPAVYALQSIGDRTLDGELRRTRFYRLLMATGSFTPGKLHLMSGVDGGFGNDDQGWTSLVLNSVPAADLPYYRFFYDRHMGREHPLPPERKYDPARAGTTWALLYYPERVPARDPDGHVERTLFDEEKGVYFFRDRWQDAGDALLSVMGDYHHHGNAWDVQEAFQLGLIAHGTPFVGGPGKEATGRDARHDGFSALLVDGQAFPRTGRVGAPVHAGARPDGGGYVVVGGGEKYAGLGLREAERHVAVDFSGGALLSTLDRVRAAEQHTYTWQLNPGGPGASGPVRVTAGEEAGRPTFTLLGADGAFVKGWVLYPAGARLEAGDPLRVSVRGADAEIWVAVLAGRGTPPAGIVQGEGTRTTLTVGARTLRLDATTGRILIEPVR